MSKHKEPAFKRAEKDAQKGRERVSKANERAHKARDILRRKYSVPDKQE